MNNVQKFMEVVEQIKKLTDEKLQLEIELYKENLEKMNGKEEGTVNVDYSEIGIRLKVIKKMTCTVDQDLADKIQLAFRKKYELDKKAYSSLDDDMKREVDKALTFKPSKPTFSIEVLK